MGPKAAVSDKKRPPIATFQSVSLLKTMQNRFKATRVPGANRIFPAVTAEKNRDSVQQERCERMWKISGGNHGRLLQKGRAGQKVVADLKANLNSLTSSQQILAKKHIVLARPIAMVIKKELQKKVLRKVEACQGKEEHGRKSAAVAGKILKALKRASAGLSPYCGPTNPGSIPKTTGRPWTKNHLISTRRSEKTLQQPNTIGGLESWSAIILIS